MKTFLVFTTFLFLFSNRSFGQDEGATTRCGTYEFAEKNKNEIPGYTEKLTVSEKLIGEWIKNHPHDITRGVVTIPVVVHVLYYGDSSLTQNISDWQVTSQIDALNEDYRRENADEYKTPGAFKPVAADCEIQFCLAKQTPDSLPTTGIVRKVATQPTFNDLSSMKHTSDGGDDAWPYTNYLNIWVCAMGMGTLGYSTLPVINGLTDEDGAVVHYKAFGRINTLSKKYNLGRTATHEIGHWLDLFHTWGDDGGGCMGSDSVADTPNQSNSNLSCAAFPKTDNCSPNSPGVMFMNYMDYTLDSCVNIFTLGQKARIIAGLNVFRSSILNSSVCNPVLANAIDIGVSDIPQPKLTITNDSITPVVTLNNFGFTTITSATIYYARNYKSALHSFNWTGNLAGGTTTNVTLPAMKDSSGYQLFIAYTKTPNGQADMDTSNDFKTRSYYVNTNLNDVSDVNQAGNTKFIIYPNPVNDKAILKFNFALGDNISDFTITNMLGQQELFTWKKIASNQIEMGLSGLPSALYFVRVKVNEKMMQQKMLIISGNK